MLRTSLRYQIRRVQSIRLVSRMSISTKNTPSPSLYLGLWRQRLSSRCLEISIYTGSHVIGLDDLLQVFKFLGSYDIHTFLPIFVPATTTNLFPVFSIENNAPLGPEINGLRPPPTIGPKPTFIKWKAVHPSISFET